MSVERYQGWLLLAHPHFEDQWSRWSNEVRRLAKKNPGTYSSHPHVKRMATLNTLVFEVVPNDPAHPRWLQGNTLGPRNRAWRRAKFGARYRLFFRFDSRSKIIIYGWINDDNSLRARGNRTDAYSVFARMLASGSPPSTWDELLRQSIPLEG